METYFLKPLIVLFFIFISIVAHSKQESFELKALPTGPSDVQEIKKGLTSLYRSKISREDLDTQVLRADNFQKSIYNAIDKKIEKNKMIQAEVTEKTLTGNFVKEITVRFPSLIQRPNDHASNTVVAKIYQPTVDRRFCEYKYPTSIFLHHILNELPMIEDLAKALAADVVHQPAIVVVLHMPHYGDRRNGQEEFLNPNFASFRENMIQLTLDVHMLRNFLETRKNVDTEKFTLAGISLGAVMGLTVGAFDQGFTGYASLVGGTDMANILFNRAQSRPDSEVAKALKGVTMDEALIRDQIAAADPMTWMHRYQQKNIFALNASKDDIINYEISVKPMLDQLKLNNKVSEKFNNDSHSPTGSIIKKIKTIFNPFLDFVIDGAQTYNEVCPGH